MSDTLHTVFGYFQKIEAASGRLEMRDLFAELFSQLDAEEGAIVAYLSLGRLTPDFVPVEFQISGKTLEKVIVEATQLDGDTLKADFTETGDLGSVLERHIHNSTSDIDTVQEFYSVLWEIALTQGKGSQQTKQTKIVDLVKKLDSVAAKYLIRILNGKLRLGASDKTILDALASLEENPKEIAEKIRQASGFVSDVGHIVYLYKKYGAALVDKAVFTPGIPVSAKLVEREATFDDIFKRMNPAYLEPKYDGLRIQVHVFSKKTAQQAFTDRVWAKYLVKTEETEQKTLAKVTDNEFIVRLFSRNLEEMTDMFPEIIDAAQKLPALYEKKTGKKIESIVLDGEVVGYNAEQAQLLTYQETMTRRRKHDIEAAKSSVPVHVFVFDFLYVDGEQVLSKKLDERKQMLSFLDDVDDKFLFSKTPFNIVTTAEEAESLFTDYISEGLEGVIFKSGDTIYEPGVRNFDWIKFKRDMSATHNLADTLDVVILGYYYGEGRLAKMGIGKLLTGVYDKENDTFLSVTKVGTKMTDEQRKMIREACDMHKVDSQPARVIVPKNLIPDVWLEPALVIEIEGFEVTKSPLHSAGYAVRFPKFMKFREKKAEDCTSLQELIELSKL